MKIKLEHIAEIITDVTDITLKQMQAKLKFPEIAEARYLFVLMALKHGKFKNNYEVTNFIGATKSIVNYAQKVQHRQDIVNTLRLIEPIIEDRSSCQMYNISIMLDKVSNADRITIANSIIRQLPVHKRQLISL